MSVMDAALRSELCALVGAVGFRARRLQASSEFWIAPLRWSLLFAAVDLVLSLAGELLAGLPDLGSDAAL